VEALAALGTPGAQAAVSSARRHPDLDIRTHALSHFLDQGPPDAALEQEVAQAVEAGAIELAEECPTPLVKRALLDCARKADETTRVNAAALLLYLCGQASEPFDWNQRDFFLRFGEEDRKELRAAWEELRQRTGL
jgi:hypothetical protein